MPPRRAVDVAELRSWLGHIHLLEVVEGGRDFRYRVFATEIGLQFDVEMTGRLVSAWREPMRSAAFETYGRVVRDRCSYLVRQNEPARDRLLCNYRLVLPFSEDGDAVDHILTHVRVIAGVEPDMGVHYHPLRGPSES